MKLKASAFYLMFVCKRTVLIQQLYGYGMIIIKNIAISSGYIPKRRSENESPLVYHPLPYLQLRMGSNTIKRFSVNEPNTFCIISSMNFAGRYRITPLIGNFRNHFYLNNM